MRTVAYGILLAIGAEILFRILYRGAFSPLACFGTVCFLAAVGNYFSPPIITQALFWDGMKLIAPWLAFRLVWRPFGRTIFRTLVKAYDYRPCDANTATLYITVVCGIVALVVSMYANGQIYWVCACRRCQCGNCAGGMCGGCAYPPCRCRCQPVVNMNPLRAPRGRPRRR